MTPVYDRNALPAGCRIEGPAVLEEVESTMILPPDFNASVDEGLNMIVTRRPGV